MSKTIVFKPEFETKLKQLKVKTKFVNNLRKYTNNSMEDVVAWLNCSKSFSLFICNAFLWRSTPEGADFWNNIANS